MSGHALTFVSVWRVARTDQVSRRYACYEPCSSAFERRPYTPEKVECLQYVAISVSPHSRYTLKQYRRRLSQESVTGAHLPERGAPPAAVKPLTAAEYLPRQKYRGIGYSDRIKKNPDASQEMMTGNWYDTAPYQRMLGKDEGSTAFDAFMRHVSATKSRSAVPDNIRTASQLPVCRRPCARRHRCWHSCDAVRPSLADVQCFSVSAVNREQWRVEEMNVSRRTALSALIAITAGRTQTARRLR